MGAACKDHSQNESKGGSFRTTRWSIVAKAGDQDAEQARLALESLCRDYWRPLYDFARRKGYVSADAKDLTQSFIARLLESNAVGRADPNRGRFRTFLLTAFCNHMVGAYRAQSAEKRGGGTRKIALAEIDEDTAPAHQGWERMTPERVYERSLAIALLERVMGRLNDDCVRAGRAELFEALRPYLDGGTRLPSYGEVGRSLGMSGSAVTVAVHRLRKRYGLLLREEIRSLVEKPEDVEPELRYLMSIVAMS